MSTASRVWTYADLQALPESQDGRRYEIIAGELIVTPSPTPPHQLVAYRLTRWVGDHVDRHGLGQLYFAPVDVVLDDETLVPDLLFIRGDRLGIVGPKAIVGGPDLVLEILSPSTQDHDLGEKTLIYARHGVREYWVVGQFESSKPTISSMVQTWSATPAAIAGVCFNVWWTRAKL